ncbi:hypothetical protein A6J63_015610 [Yersinia enterocolitica]|nr:hypothetical protein A6J63_015610 [Yersinia enterocolitica]
MNNIEARIERLKSKFEIAKSYSSDQLTVPMPDLSALIAQLEAAQKELSAANEKLSKPVVLPMKYNPAFAGNKATRTNFMWHNDAISYCADAIKAAGFKVEGE